MENEQDTKKKKNSKIQLNRMALTNHSNYLSIEKFKNTTAVDI